MCGQLHPYETQTGYDVPTNRKVEQKVPVKAARFLAMSSDEKIYVFTKLLKDMCPLDKAGYANI